MLWALVIGDRTVGVASDRHRQSSLRQRQQPWKANRQREPRNRQRGRRRWKPERSKFKVLMDSHSAFIPPNTRPSRVNVNGSVHYLRKRAEGRGNPLVGESSTSIFIEWNWICTEDRPVLARLHSSLPAFIWWSPSPLAEHSSQQYREPAVCRTCPRAFAHLKPMKVKNSVLWFDRTQGRNRSCFYKHWVEYK